MRLAVGERVGCYEIAELLGVGGMGEVYRARDTRLNRDVALKVLPDSFAADRDRLMRFTREAQVLASLNHPNIAQIHGLEDVGAGSTLVMELVTGETLAARLTRGALPVDAALDIATQVIDALAAAHDQNIVHRDLKPANIALRADGAVKVLDFGLAKTADGSGSASDAMAAMSPTITSPATLVGTILGTAAYMAPEQARGRAVDRRADIWAFGCVLFEMLTGRRAFEGEDVSLTLAKILERDPDFTRLPPGVLPYVAATLRLCLQKDPKHRISDIRDVRLGLSGAFASGSDPRTGTGVAPATRRWLGPVPLALAAIVLLMLGVLAGRALRSRPVTAAAEPEELSILLSQGVEYAFSSVPSRSLAISPDGRRIVIRGRGDGKVMLYRRSLASRAIEPIPGTEEGRNPSFSPDGGAIVFVAAGTLKTVPFDGSALPKALVPTADPDFPAFWRGDEIIFSSPGRRELLRVPATGGTATTIATREVPCLQAVAVENSGDILCGFRRPDRNPQIDLLTLQTGASTELIDNARPVAHLPSGHVVFEREGALMAALLDPAARRVGPAAPVLRGFAFDPGPAFSQVVISPTGTLAYMVAPAAPQAATLAWVDASGALTGIGELPAGTVAVDRSQSGMAVIDVIGSPRRVMLWDMERKAPAGLQVQRAMTPRWHPDGRHFAIGKGPQLVLVDSEDGSETVLASNPGGSVRSPSFSADGSSVAYVASKSSLFDIYGLVPGAPAPRPVIATDAFEHSPALSPDGKWLAYVDTGDVYIARFPSGTGRRRVSTNGGYQPVWRRDGRALFYHEWREPAPRDDTRDMRVVPVEAGETLKLGVPRTLFPVDTPSAPLQSYTFGNEGAAFHATADGNRFLMVYRPPPQPLTELAVVRNWLTELERLVPRK